MAEKWTIVDRHFANGECDECGMLSWHLNQLQDSRGVVLVEACASCTESLVSGDYYDATSDNQEPQP